MKSLPHRLDVLLIFFKDVKTNKNCKGLPLQDLKCSHLLWNAALTNAPKNIHSFFPSYPGRQAGKKYMRERISQPLSSHVMPSDKF